MMYKSKEIRWFKKAIDLPILIWFQERNINFENIIPRTDHYLVLSEREDLNIKTREGKIEIKQRSSGQTRGELIAGAEGYFENWEKWSFQISPDDSLAVSLSERGSERWIPVEKCRMGIKYIHNRHSKPAIVAIDDLVSSACQIEYTRLVVKKEIWYSFNLEWFGEERVEPDNEFLTELIKDSKLGIKSSMSYTGFINKNFRF